MRVVAFLAAAVAGYGSAFAAVPYEGLLAIPASASGELVQSSVTLAYLSDGYALRECTVVVSSEDQNADQQACKTVSHRATVRPIEAIAPVWKKPIITGKFIAPTPKNNPASWFRLDDVSCCDVQGTSIIRLDVDAQGAVSACTSLEPRGSRLFENLAKRTICKRAKFLPATLDDKPVGATILTTIKVYVGR